MSEEYVPELIYYDEGERLEFVVDDAVGVWRELGHGLAILMRLPDLEPVGFRLHCSREYVRAAVPNDGTRVELPLSADQAVGMILIAENWLKQYAPERLRP